MNAPASSRDAFLAPSREQPPAKAGSFRLRLKAGFSRPQGPTVCGPRTLRSVYRCSRLATDFEQTQSHLIRWQDQIAAGVYDPNRRRSAFQQALGASERVINRCISCVARFGAVCRFGRHEITRRHSGPPVCFFAVAFSGSMASKRHREQARNLPRFIPRSGALSATKFEIVALAARMLAPRLLRIAQMRRNHEIERHP
jgi:hypothetical protein